jgi:hypothetical protein
MTWIVICESLYCSWAAGSRAWVFRLLIILLGLFLSYAHQLFGKICVRPWVTCRFDFVCWNLTCDLASINCHVSLCFQFPSQVLRNISYSITMWSWSCWKRGALGLSWYIGRVILRNFNWLSFPLPSGRPLRSFRLICWLSSSRGIRWKVKLMEWYLIL